MGTMRGGVWRLAILVLLLLSMQRSEAIWPGKKDPEPAATAAGAAKEYAREAVRNTADAANNVGESIKQTANAAYETTASAARTVTGGKSDSGATGAAYRDRAGNYVVDTATATQRRAADAAGAVRDTAANSAQTARETTGRAYDATADTLGSAKERVWGAPEPEPTYTQRAADAARRASQNVRDGSSRAYDATADRFTQEDNRGVYERTRDTVWGAPEEPTYTQRAADAARRASQNVRDGASRAYDATAAPFTQEDNRGVYEKTRDTVWGAPEPEPTYTQRAADAVRRASQNVRDGASRAYDATTAPFTREDNRGMYEKARDSASRAYDATTAPFTREDNRGMYEKARDTAYRAGQSTRDSGYRAVGYEPPSEQGYASRAYDSILGSSSDAYESGKNRLGSIVEILGWTRVPEDDHNYGPVTASLGKYRSPYDVMVGNTRYVWGKQPEEPESYYQSAKATVAEKASGAANSMGQAKDATVETASRASESVKDMAEKTGQKGMEVVNAGAAAVGADKLVKDGFFRKLWRFVHLLTWGVTLGTAVWMTFMSGRVLQQNMPREQFRTVQTKLFPSYLRFLTAGEGVLAFLYFFLSNSSNWQTLNLLLLVGASAYNAYVLEPQTTKIYLDRLRLEKEEGKGLISTENVNEELDEKNKKFKELHGYSATLNLLSLAGLTYHAWNMVSRVYV